MTRLLKTRHTHELLQAAPVLAGGVPEHSALVLPAYGGRIGSAMRIDLPDDQLDAWAASVVHLAGFVDADSAAVILYPSVEIGSGQLPMTDVAIALTAAAGEARLPLSGLFIVGTDCWGDFSRPEAPRGTAAELLDPDLRFDGAEPGPLRSGDAAVPGAMSDRASAAQRRRIDALCNLCEETCPIDAAQAAFDLPPEELTAAEAAVLSTLVQVPVVRDEILMTLIAGVEEGARTRAGAQQWHATGQSERVEYEASMLMGITGDLDLTRLRRALSCWRRVTELTVSEQRPAVLAVLGWLHWALGEASSAAACIQRALEGDDAHSFSRIVESIIGSGHVPVWIQQRMRHAAEQDG